MINISEEVNDYSPFESRIAQSEYCKSTGKPHFAPKSGDCWDCRKNIYSKQTNLQGIVTGITTIKATTSLVTGCPHCNRSYCD